tara:strand:- start:218 stop:355 length:138 start_codon:yes stop_codon:yes gene_type:complete
MTEFQKFKLELIQDGLGELMLERGVSMLDFAAIRDALQKLEEINK